MKKLLLLLVFPFIALAQTDPLNSAYKPSSSCTQVSNIWVTDTMTKVLQGNSTPGTGCSILVYATQGEFADFQVHVVAPGGGYSALNIVSSGYTQAAPNTTTPIPAPDATHNNVLVYREGYITLTKLTSSGTGYYNTLGAYPDPLIPTIDPYFHQTTNAFPVPVAANQTQSAWVDVLIPGNAKSGYYSGTITVSNSGTTLATINVIIAVWQWPAAQGGRMPATPTLPTELQYGYGDFCYAIYGGSYGGPCPYPGSGGNANIGEALANEAGAVIFMDHRWTMTDPIISTSSPGYTNWIGLLDGVTALPAGVPPPILTGATVTGQAFRSAATWGGSLQNYATIFKSPVYPSGSTGTYPKVSIFGQYTDEPGDNWAGVCSSATTTHATTPPTVVSVTGTVQQMNENSGTAGCTGTANGVLDVPDIIVGLTACMEPAAQFICSAGQGSNRPIVGNNIPLYSTWLNHTNPNGIKPQLWSYTDCVAATTNIGQGCGSATVGQTSYPNYYVDSKPAGNRATEWETYLHGQTGELYFYTMCIYEPSNDCPAGTGTAPSDPWTNVYLFSTNGDGTLIYPSSWAGAGTAATHVGQPGGAALATPIYIPSVRMKHMRDGGQDWEYMNALTVAGQANYVYSQIASPSLASFTNGRGFNVTPGVGWVTNSYTFETSGTGLQTARTNLGNTLHQITFPSFPSSGCASTGATTWACAAGATTAQIQTAINAALPNEVITFQAGTYTSTGSLIVQNASGNGGAPAVSPGVTLQCATTALTQGAAFTNPCIISNGVSSFLIGDYHAQNDNLIRLTGFVFLQNNRLDHVGLIALYSGCGNTAVTTCYGGYNRVRVDHNTFIMLDSSLPGSDILNVGNGGGLNIFSGVVDHNIGCSSGSSTVSPCSNYASIGVGAAPSIQWAFQVGGVHPDYPPNPSGTINNIFLEDNLSQAFLATGTGGAQPDCFMDGWGGVSFVVRNNTITDQLACVHGNGGDGGPANVEFYNNTTTLDTGMASPYSTCYRSMHHQGSGTFMSFNNVFNCAATPVSSDVIEIFDYRGYNFQLTEGSPYPYATQCTGFFSTPPVQDGNRAPINTGFGYPCWHQPGRDFHANLYPMYSWNNQATGSLVRNLYNNAFNVSPYPAYGPAHIQVNRDIYDSASFTANTTPTSPWDCATASVANGGMGFGTLANRPTDCAPYTGEAGGGFGYFATDQGPIGIGGVHAGILYQFGAGGWTQVYQPYTYPHPLVSGSAIAAMPVMNPTTKASLTAINGLTMTSSTPGATIWYTLNNTQPTCGPASATLFQYTAPINVTTSQTFSSIACATGFVPSYTNTSHYAINEVLPTPTFSNYPGVYATTFSSLEVFMPAELPPFAIMCYTTNGTVPVITTPGTCPAGSSPSILNASFVAVCNSTATCQALPVPVTVNAVATSAAYQTSAVATATYTFSGTNGMYISGGSGQSTTAAFGTWAVGAPSAHMPLSIANVCYAANGAPCTTTATTVSAATITGTNAADFTDDGTGTCNTARTPGATSFPQTLNGQQYCSLNIVFKPSVNGPETATLTVTDTAAGTNHSITLTGTGSGASSPTATLAPAAGLAFGNQNTNTTSSGLVATLTNTGSVPVVVNQAQTFNTDFTVTNQGSCFTTFGSNTSFTLPVGRNCNYVITFTPSVTGLRTGSFAVGDNATGSPQTIALSGTGTAPIITWSSPQGGTTYNFGNTNGGSMASSPSVCTTPANCLELTNTGTGLLNVSLSITGSNIPQFSPITSTTCGTTLAVGSSCAVVVTFSPPTVTSATSYTAFLTESDNVQGTSGNLTLNGTGVPAPGIVAPWPSMIISHEGVNNEIFSPNYSSPATGGCRVGTDATTASSCVVLGSIPY